MQPAEILVLISAAIPPTPVVSSSTMISGGLKRVQGHVSPVSGVVGMTRREHHDTRSDVGVNIVISLESSILISWSIHVRPM